MVGRVFLKSSVSPSLCKVKVSSRPSLRLAAAEGFSLSRYLTVKSRDSHNQPYCMLPLSLPLSPPDAPAEDDPSHSSSYAADISAQGLPWQTSLPPP